MYKKIEVTSLTYLVFMIKNIFLFQFNPQFKCQTRKKREYKNIVRVKNEGGGGGANGERTKKMLKTGREENKLAVHNSETRKMHRKLKRGMRVCVCV